MKKLITTNTTTVFSRVRTMSEYIGAKLLPKDPEAYQRISAIEADDDLLREMVPGIMSQLSARLGCHSAGSSVKEGVVTLALDLSKGHTSDLIPDMTADMEAHLVYSLLAKWMSIASPGAETTYSDMAESFAESLRRKASCKSNPIS